MVFKIISTTIGRGINRASYNANGFVGSRRNAAEIAGSTTDGTTSGSAFCRFDDCDKSSVAGRFREISSVSYIFPLTCDVRKYWSIRFDSGPAAFVLHSAM
jgi:hypothetical protein